MVVIEATDGGVDEILAQLGKMHDFKIERLAGGDTPRLWSGRFQGSLEDAFAILLTGENYLVEHSGGAKFGIANVKMFGASAAAETQLQQSEGRPVAFVPTPATGRAETAQPPLRDVRQPSAAGSAQPKRGPLSAIPATPPPMPVRRQGNLAQ